jgi:hypothetical protein
MFYRQAWKNDGSARPNPREDLLQRQELGAWKPIEKQR